MVTDKQRQHSKDPHNIHTGHVPMGDDRETSHHVQTPRCEKSRKWRTQVMRLLSQPLFIKFPRLRIRHSEWRSKKSLPAVPQTSAWNARAELEQVWLISFYIRNKAGDDIYYSLSWQLLFLVIHVSLIHQKLKSNHAYLPHSEFHFFLEISIIPKFYFMAVTDLYIFITYDKNYRLIYTFN